MILDVASIVSQEAAVTTSCTECTITRCNCKVLAFLHLFASQMCKACEWLVLSLLTLSTFVCLLVCPHLSHAHYYITRYSAVLTVLGFVGEGTASKCSLLPVMILYSQVTGASWNLLLYCVWLLYYPIVWEQTDNSSTAEVSLNWPVAAWADPWLFHWKFPAGFWWLYISCVKPMMRHSSKTDCTCLLSVNVVHQTYMYTG